MATAVSRVGSQRGGGDIYEWDEGGSCIHISGARGSRYVGVNHGPGLGLCGGGGNVGAIYGPGARSGGNVGSVYRDVEGRESNIVTNHGHREGGNYRASGSLRGNIGAIYASGTGNTGGNIDEIFLPGRGIGGTVGGSWRVT